MLKDRGYGEYSGLISPNRTKFIVNIPKNASSYVHSWAVQCGWQTAILEGDQWNTVNQLTVILRDPVERWISGMAQYLKTYVLSPMGPNGPIFPNSRWANHPENQSMSAGDFISLYNRASERLIFDNLHRFDDHVWPQYAFILTLRPYLERKFYMLDETFDKKFAFGHGFSPAENIDRNKGDSDKDTKDLQDFLKNLLDNSPNLLDRVKTAYAEDYKLIDKAFNESR